MPVPAGTCCRPRTPLRPCQSLRPRPPASAPTAGQRSTRARTGACSAGRPRPAASTREARAGARPRSCSPRRRRWCWGRPRPHTPHSLRQARHTAAPRVITVAQAPTTTTPTTPGAASTPGAATPGTATTPGALGTPTTIKPLPGTSTPPKIPLSAPTPKSPSATTTPSTGTGSGESGTGTTKSSTKPSGGTTTPEPTPILLDTNAAVTYNPYGYPASEFGDPSLAIDGETSTAWTAQVNPAVAPKMAEGLAVDLKTGQRVGTLKLISSTPGMTVQVYGANGASLPASITDPAWTRAEPRAGREEAHDQDQAA